MTELLGAAGFALRSTTVKEPEEGRGESLVPQAFLLAQKEE